MALDLDKGESIERKNFPEGIALLQSHTREAHPECCVLSWTHDKHFRFKLPLPEITFYSLCTVHTNKCREILGSTSIQVSQIPYSSPRSTLVSLT